MNGSKSRESSKTAIIEEAEYVCNLTETANATVGRLIATQFFIQLIMCSCGIYLALGLFNVVSDGVLMPVVLGYGIANTLMGLFSVLILWELMSQGQRAADTFRAIKSVLQKTVVSAVRESSLDEEERARLDVLVERFSTEAPIQPMHVFNVNFATGASLSGLVLTYIIVLLQFKVGDT